MRNIRQQKIYHDHPVFHEDSEKPDFSV